MPLSEGSELYASALKVANDGAATGYKDSNLVACTRGPEYMALEVVHNCPRSTAVTKSMQAS